jgi:hypothetical protein
MPQVDAYWIWIGFMVGLVAGFAYGVRGRSKSATTEAVGEPPLASPDLSLAAYLAANADNMTDERRERLIRFWEQKQKELKATPECSCYRRSGPSFITD